ncbi:hypothetical protein DES52_101359 [Deinococcus yavapaiensis KR-236]|uniref:Uncharacterized protein n=1 Tax=Deinococcus yavapaiensis KR-236 TaxID=694435 RepID=A0A318SGM0_9DEIO|nr:hypothetical protein DES52_101359 [Deinococcus yavapaiensis KR-236]
MGGQTQADISQQDESATWHTGGGGGYEASALACRSGSHARVRRVLTNVPKRTAPNLERFALSAKTATNQELAAHLVLDRHGGPSLAPLAGGVG